MHCILLPFLATVTPLQARTFGAWTLTSAIVRAYAAYNISNKPFVFPIMGPARWLNLSFSIYDMAMLTYLIAFGHFFSEFLIFRTAKFGAGLLGPAVVSSRCMSMCLAKPLTKRFSRDVDLDDHPV